MIILPHAKNVTICPKRLVDYFAKNNITKLRIGAEKISYDGLAHEVTLERWIRLQLQNETHKNTMQAVEVVVDNLCKTGLFSRASINQEGIKGKNPQAVACDVLPNYEKTLMEDTV